MATYFVDASSGNDADDGLSASSAWKTGDYAVAIQAAGDMLVVTAPATMPSRNGIAPTAAGTYRGAASDDRAYIVGSVSVSHGAAIENPIRNGGMEAWLSASEAWAVQVTGDAIARSTDVHGGTYSINATKTAANIYLNVYVYLPANTSMDFTYWHKGSVAGRWQFNILELDPAPDNYLQADGSWANAAHTFDPNDFGVAWHSYTKNFTTNAAGRYQLILAQKFAETVYLDDVSLAYNGAAAFQWSDVIGKNYKELDIAFPLQPRILAKCSVAGWTSSGVDALVIVPLVADLATCDATPSSWYYDAVNDLIYYCPADGEAVADLHLELAQPRLNTSAVEDSGLVYLNASDIVIENLVVRYSNNFGILTGPARSGLQASYVESSFAGNTCWYVIDGSALVANYCLGRYSYIEEIFQVVGAGSRLTTENCIAEYACDDGFQAGAEGTLICTRCISRLNGTENAGDNSGFISEGADCTVELTNCTAYGNYGQGIAHHGTGVGSMTVRNCIAYGTVSGPTYDAYLAAVHSTFTHDHNLFGNHGGAWVVDATEIEGSDPLFVGPSGDLRLQPNSPAIDAGVDVGLIYHQSAPDCGAYEYEPPLPPVDNPYLYGKGGLFGSRPW